VEKLTVVATQMLFSGVKWDLIRLISLFFFFFFH